MNFNQTVFVTHNTTNIRRTLYSKGWNVSKREINQIRYGYLDIAKGIGIILVVWAHASGPGSAIIYQFHMPLFFLISGYLYSKKAGIKEFTVRKIRSLYCPFVFWNLTVMFLKTLNYQINGMPAAAYAGKTFIKTILLLDKDNQFLGATWFLGALFYMSLLYKVWDTFCKQWRYKQYFILAVFTIQAMFGFRITLPYFLSRTLILGMFYALGYSVREHEEQFKKLDSSVTAVICMALFLLIGFNSYVNMGHNEYSSPMLFVAGACMASYYVVWASRRIENITADKWLFISKELMYLGKHSLDIVIWQFVFFRIVIAVQLLVNGLSVTSILDYYPVYESNHGWWIAYTIAGTVFPILWVRAMKCGPWGRLLKAVHAV